MNLLGTFPAWTRGTAQTFKIRHFTNGVPRFLAAQEAY
jgi:hypothetical protein